MAGPKVEQRLAAILAADVAGYSRLMGQDERATIATLSEFRDVFQAKIEANKGRVVDMAGDSVLAVFNSATGAVRAATEAQSELAKRNEGLPDDRRMLFRVGVNLGDIHEAEDGRVYGDGVNVAARLEAMANPGGINVSGSVFDSVRAKIDIPFDYLGEHEVKNIADPVRAYSLGKGSKRKSNRRPHLVAAAAAIAAVFAVGGYYFWPQPQAPEEAPSIQAILAEADFPTIAVIPFENVSGDPDQDYFAIGLTEALIERLAQFTEYSVISRNSTNRYAGTDIDPQQISQDLGARYIVYGTANRLDDTIRMSVRVVKGETGELIWAETYEADLTVAGLFEIQDRFMETAAARIFDYKGAVGLAEAETTPPGAQTESLQGYDCIWRAFAFWDTLSPEIHAASRACLERAVEQDPDFVDGWAHLADLYRAEHAQGVNPLPNSLDRALAAARKAVELEPDYYYANNVLAYVHFFRGEIDQFNLRAERTIALNPGSPTALADLGNQMVVSGRVDDGLAMLLRAVSLNPYHPVWYNYGLAAGYYMKGDYEAALAAALKLNWGIFWDHLHRAVNYAQLGRSEEAQQEIAELLAKEPHFARDIWQHFRQFHTPDEKIEMFIDGLRKAGMTGFEDQPLTN